MVDENASKPSGEPADEERSALPMALAAAGLLAVAAVIVFWPSGSNDSENAGDRARPLAADGKGPGRRGGVQARGYDEAEHGKGKGRINPALQLPGAGMAPGPPPSREPPEFDTPMEEIAWWQKRVGAAESNLTMRERALGRLDRAREQAEAAQDPAEALARFEESKKTVEKNHELARQELAEAQAKLAELKAKAGQ